MMDFLLKPRGSLIIGLVLIIGSKVVGAWVPGLLFILIQAEGDPMARNIFSLLYSAVDILLQVAFGLGIVLLAVAVVVAKLDRLHAGRVLRESR